MGVHRLRGSHQRPYLGINSSYGVFLNHYLSTNTYPSATQLHYALIGGLSISMTMFMSLLATGSTRRYAMHLTLTISIILEAGGLIGASFATSIWHLCLSQGIAFRFDMGFLFVPSDGIPPQWFTTRRSLASGIGTAGSGFGGLLYSIASGAMIESIGPRWCFRVLGLLALVLNTICIILIRDRNKIIASRHASVDTKLTPASRVPPPRRLRILLYALVYLSPSPSLRLCSTRRSEFVTGVHRGSNPEPRPRSRPAAIWVLLYRRCCLP